MTTLNIPNITVSEVVNALCELYTNALEKQIPLRQLPTPFLWGPAGIGKSDGVRQLSERLRVATGKRVVVTDIRLLLFSPVDLRGVPMADEQRHFTNWLRPKIFDLEADSDTVNLLFLDELSAAPQSVQAAAYQICLDRRVGEHMLPDNCIVIAAGNRVTDQSVSYKMPKALCNRLMHFNICCDYGAWRSWALSKGVSEKVIAFLGKDSSRLLVEPRASELAYPTPRSWAFVGSLLQTVSEDPEKIHHLIAGAIGNDTALEFEVFCKGVLQMPSTEEIFAGRCKELPKGHDVLYALMTGLAAQVKSKGYRLTAEELENVCCYVLRFPKDFSMAFMRDINEIEGINKKLMKCHSFQNWLNKNRSFM